MHEIIAVGQAIVDPTRVRIIASLRRGELCVCELVDALEINQSTLSGHLQVLRQTGLVTTRKEGRWIYYSLTDRKIALIEALWHGAKEMSQVWLHERRSRPSRTRL